MKISACVCTKNVQKDLPGLLDNLLGRVDEIVIVDGESTDDTVEIAATYTNSIYEGTAGHPDGDRHIYVENAKHDYLLVADADERFCTPFLEQLRFLESADGYWITRRNYYTPDKYYQHIIYPDLQLRLFNRRKLSKINARIHSRPVIDGYTFVLPQEYYIRHLAPIFSDRAKYRRYAKTQASENPGQPSTVKAIGQFIQWYGFALKTGCWKDGAPGMGMAYSQAFYHYWLYKYGYQPPANIVGEAGEVRDNMIVRSNI